MIRRLATVVSTNLRTTMATQSKGQFKCATFNLLAPCYKAMETCQWTWWYSKESSFPDHYIPRYESIIELLKTESVNADIVCFQEFWFKDFVFDLFKSQLGHRYEIVKLKRLGFKSDGLVILVDKAHKVKSIENIMFNDAAQRVGLLVHIELATNCEIIVVTTHLAYGNGYWDQYLRQSEAKKLMDAIDLYARRYKDVPVIIAGDFNGPEDSPVCECIFEEEFESAYKTVHGHEPKVTHKDHSENCVAVDYIFYRSSTKSILRPIASELSPEEYGHEEWPADFTLSDHRLLTAQFEVIDKER